MFLDKKKTKVNGFKKYLRSLVGRKRKADNAFSFGHVAFLIAVGHSSRDVESLVKYMGLTKVHQKRIYSLDWIFPHGVGK